MTLLLNAYYNRPTDCKVVDIVHNIWIWRSEYINALLSVCAALEISVLTDNIVSLAN